MGGEGGEGSLADSDPFSLQFSMTMAREKTDSWLTEAARMSTTLGLHSPVLQCCMRVLEEFRNYLPLLTKLGSLQLQNFQALLQGVFWVERGKGRERKDLGIRTMLTTQFPASPVGNTFPPWVAPCLVSTGTDISNLLHHHVGPLC